MQTVAFSLIIFPLMISLAWRTTQYGDDVKWPLMMNFKSVRKINLSSRQRAVL